MSRVWWVAFAIAFVSCSAVEPAERAAVIEYSGCGDAFAGEVAAVLIGPARAVTVAHGVVQADALEVEWRGSRYSADVVAFDSRSDLALLAIPGIDVDGVDFGDPVPRSEVTMVGGLASGELPLVVEDTVTIRIEEVLGTRRVARDGMRLTGAAAVGDSGAGLFDVSGALVGVVFAVDDDVTGSVWATAAAEVKRLLDVETGEWRCDPGRSRLTDAQG